ncbi:hypothetical protein JQ506_25065 (plasmid) [Shinella sp. PSBB067]|uniref:DUF1403 family protein n=1 Tax=Shinella sp. PSBB067 TaxID=2715959 RepID=UPI00193BC5A5|nr:hypothetical protein JQ506_25065 [Shinella sp. PSBB067]
MGRNEAERAWRDALLLTAAADDPWPAGWVLLACQRFSARKPANCGRTRRFSWAGLG